MPKINSDFSFYSSSVENTQEFGRRLGRVLKPLDIICLAGNLGAGKTAFAEGIARGAGFKGDVMSPSFGLVRLYRTPKLNLYHMDLFRVSENETGEIGLEDCLGDPKGAVIIEWARAARIYLTPDRLEVSLEYKKEGRQIILRALGPRSRRLIDLLKLRLNPLPMGFDEIN
jgi:tRNA threonylcarbamoyladenosine biosynthesis protein TsaE